MTETSYSQDTNRIIKRGRILRDTSQTEGLISIDGQQSSFTLEKHWRCDAVPVVGMTVKAAFDTTGQLVEVSAIPDAELAKEELARLAETSQQKAKEWLVKAQAIGGPLLRRIVQEVGILSLLAIAGVYIGFTQLTSFTVTAGADDLDLTQYLTFFDLLKLSSARFNDLSSYARGDAGFAGTLCYAAMLAPFLPHVLKKKREFWLGYLAPLAMMITVPVVMWTGLPPYVRQHLLNPNYVDPSARGVSMSDFGNEMAVRLLKMMHIELGFGLYLAAAAAIFLAAKGAFKFLAHR